ncbi:MAG: glycosyltransferase family 8 protein [Bacteroidota bacterium]
MHEDLFKNAIYKHEVISKPGNCSKKDRIHVALCADEKYVCRVGITITSVVINNPGLSFAFHLIISSINAEDYQRLQEFGRKYDAELHLYYINIEIFNLMPTAFSVATYYRFLVPKALQGISKEVLYLDADLICLSSLKEIRDLDITNCIAAVAHDVKDVTVKRIKKLGLKTGKYFNAGVMYINVGYWNQEDISNQAAYLLNQNPSLYSLFDQDALNKILENKLIFVNERWNLLEPVMIKDIPPGTIFLHYAGRLKPWIGDSIPNRSSARYLYYHYTQLSLWNSVSLQNPTNHSDMRRYSKALIKEGDYAKGIYWYGKYLQAKLKH